MRLDPHAAGRWMPETLGAVSSSSSSMAQTLQLAHHANLWLVAVRQLLRCFQSSRKRPFCAFAAGEPSLTCLVCCL